MPKTVLDVGAYDGYASSHYVEEGDRWILVDNEQWRKYDSWKEPKPPVKPVISEYHIMDILEWQELADVVVCSNVLYHVNDPFALLIHLKKLTKGILYLSTYYEQGDDIKWEYYAEKKTCHWHKGTNMTIFYRPTVRALKESLRMVGFTNINENIHGEMVTFTCS